MKEPTFIEKEKQSLDLEHYKYRGAKEEDYHTLITEPTVIVEQGKPTIVYLELEDDHRSVVQALQEVHYGTSGRTGGMLSTSRTIGFQPRVTLRRDYCSATSLAREVPEAHQLITSYAKRVAQYYQQYNAELYQEHQQMTERVLPEWTLEDSVFTSGIINKNNALLYHFDTGNFKRVWSNMLVFKHAIKGGYLAVPEYDIGFELKDNSLLMFDGQNILHGVTPFKLLNQYGYRYSIVFYYLQQMWNCLPVNEELTRIRKVRTEREERRAKGLTAEDVVGEKRSKNE